MKHMHVAVFLLSCGCGDAYIPHHTPEALSKVTTVVPNTVLPVFDEKEKPDCIPTVEYKTVTKVQTQLVTPDMVYFCTTYDVKDQLKCLKWEKSYKAMICLGKDCKTWTQGEATEAFGNVRD